MAVGSAVGSIDFYSKCLSRCVTFRIVLPNDLPAERIAGNVHYDRNMKTLMLLHGYSANCSDWINCSLIVEYARKYNLAIICPSGENSCYLDGKETGRQYASYVGEELLCYARKTFGLSDKPEDTYIGGISMGGFGAIHTGLQYNHSFSKIFAFSPAMIIHDVEKMKPGDIDETGKNYDFFKMVFGDPEQLASSINNPEELVRRIQKRGDYMPDIFMACGTEDDLIEHDREFYKFMKEQEIEITYYESSGAHDWDFWNRYLEPAICWLLGE